MTTVKIHFKCLNCGATETRTAMTADPIKMEKLPALGHFLPAEGIPDYQQHRCSSKSVGTALIVGIDILGLGEEG